MTSGNPTAPSSRVQRASDQVHCTVDGSVVIMTLADGQYFELNPVGARIWEELEQPTTVAEIVDQLTADYEIDVDTCTAEVEEWLDKMRSLGLVLNVD